MYEPEQLENDIKVLSEVHSQWYNGWHLSGKDWADFQETVKRIKNLEKVIPKDIGIDES